MIINRRFSIGRQIWLSMSEHQSEFVLFNAFHNSLSWAPYSIFDIHDLSKRFSIGRQLFSLISERQNKLLLTVTEILSMSYISWAPYLLSRRSNIIADDLSLDAIFLYRRPRVLRFNINTNLMLGATFVATN